VGSKGRVSCRTKERQGENSFSEILCSVLEVGQFNIVWFYGCVKAVQENDSDYLIFFLHQKLS